MLPGRGRGVALFEWRPRSSFPTRPPSAPGLEVLCPDIPQGGGKGPLITATWRDIPVLAGVRGRGRRLAGCRPVEPCLAPGPVLTPSGVCGTDLSLVGGRLPVKAGPQVFLQSLTKAE